MEAEPEQSEAGLALARALSELAKLIPESWTVEVEPNGQMLILPPSLPPR